MSKKGTYTTADRLTQEQKDKLFDGLHNDRNYLWELYCRLAYSTGFRVSDIKTLKWDDILNKEFLYKEEQKTKKFRMIDFDETVRNKYHELHSLLGSPALSQIIFISPVTGKPYTTQYINELFKKFRVKYQLFEVKNFSTHSLRKTFGRFVYDTSDNKSETIVLLNQIFNHSSLETTHRYIGLQREDFRKVYHMIKF